MDVQFQIGMRITGGSLASSRLARVLIGLHIILTGTGDLSIAPTLSSGPLPYLATTAFPANSFPDGSEDFSVASASSWGRKTRWS